MKAIVFKTFGFYSQFDVIILKPVYQRVNFILPYTAKRMLLIKCIDRTFFKS